MRGSIRRACYDRIAALPEQIDEAWAAASRLDAARELSRTSSAWSCSAWAAPASAAASSGRWPSTLARRFPIDVVRGYTLPAYVGPRDAGDRVIEQRQHRGDRRACGAGRRGRREVPRHHHRRASRSACAERRPPRAGVRVGGRTASRARLELRVAPGDLRARSGSAARRRHRHRGRAPRDARAGATAIGRDVPKSSNPAKQLARAPGWPAARDRRRRGAGAGRVSLAHADQREREVVGDRRRAAGDEPQRARRLRRCRGASCRCCTPCCCVTRRCIRASRSASS